jgi:23S rRNA-/tRNA-specific pseudouridylate synthase
VYPLHRLDKETSGVLLFAKDPRVAKVILEKFAMRNIEKTYLVITKLCPKIPEGTIKIPIGEGKVGGTDKFRMVLKPDLRKYEIKARQGDCREAITHFTVLNSIKEAAFLKVVPESGVKHQIRLHLGLGIGCPILGDHKYSHRDRMAPQRLHPLLLNRLKLKQSKVRELPLHLHCSSISFTLPEEFTKSPDPIYVHAKVPNYFAHTLRAIGLSK